jgi:hypothetical protein
MPGTSLEGRGALCVIKKSLGKHHSRQAGPPYPDQIPCSEMDLSSLWRHSIGKRPQKPLKVFQMYRPEHCGQLSLEDFVLPVAGHSLVTTAGSSWPS